MSNEVFLDIKDRELIIKYLTDLYTDQEKTKYYSKGNQLASWEEYIKTQHDYPWGDLWEYSSDELLESFLNYFFKNADLNYWANANYINLEQAIAITFGKDPLNIDWDLIRKIKSIPIAIDIKCFEQKMNSTLFINLEKIELLSLLEWLKENEVQGSDEKFIQNLTKKRGDFVDWKEKFLFLEKKYNQALLENSELKEELNSLGKKVHGRSEKSYIGMFAGLLAFSYSPERIISDSLKASEVNGDIFENSGVNLTDEAVRGYLDKVKPILKEHLKEIKI